MLEVFNVMSCYGPVTALKDVSLRVGRGDFVTVLGSNGAGKTTLMKTIAGLHALKSGKLLFEGRDISRAPSHERIKSGICLVPEGRHIFPKMSVYENLILGAFSCPQADSNHRAEEVFNLFPDLKQKKSQKAGKLSGGQQQMVALGRGLMARPKLLLLDEPSLGLAPIVIEQIFEVIKALNKEEGTTVVLVEQNAEMALRISDRAYILETGRIAMEGACSELQKSEYVRKSYLGI